MARKCCVKNCKNAAEKNENRTTVFKFPDKYTKKYEDWMTALGNNITEGRSTRKNLFICALHFQPECFENADTQIFKNDEMCVVPRKVNRLKDVAIPSIFNNAGGSESTVSILKGISENEIEAKKNYPGSVKSLHAEVKDGNALITHKRNKTKKPTPTLQLTSNNVVFNFVNSNIMNSSAAGSTSQVQKTSDLNLSPPTDVFQAVSSTSWQLSVKKEVNSPVEELCTDFTIGIQNCIDIPEVKIEPLEEEIPESSISAMAEICEDDVDDKKAIQSLIVLESQSEQLKEEISEPSTSALDEICNDDDDIDDKKAIHSLIGLESLPPTETATFSVPREWIDCTKLPKNWGAMELINGSVIFVYIDEVLGQPTRSLLVKSDLTTEIAAGGRSAKIPSSEKVATFDEVHLLLQKIAHFRLCVGPDDSGCDNAVLFWPVHKSSSVRCKPCQKLRKMKKNNYRRKMKRKKAAKLKRKYRRSVQKIDSLQGEVRNLMAGCNETGEQQVKEKNTSRKPKRGPRKRKSTEKDIYEAQEKLAKKL